MEEQYIKIKLHNFQKWDDKEIILQKGVNLISGFSGAGKSTFARAIHFCLYGGRKYKLSMNQKKKTNKIFVELIFRNVNGNFKIKRERPSETLTVTDEDNIYRDQEAQGWIESKFGTEESWISSSYLGQEKDNFFMSETDAKKKDLLYEIVFGKCTNDLDPDVLVNGIKSKIDLLDINSMRLNETIKIKTENLNKLVDKYEEVLEYEFITEECFEELDERIEKLKLELRRIDVSIHEQKKLKEYSAKLEDLNSQLQTINVFENIDIELIQEKLNLEKALKNFDERVVNYSTEEIYKNKSIYEFLFSKGMDKDETIDDFKDYVKEREEKYETYLKSRENYETIKNENRIIKIENDNLRSEFDRKNELYNRYKRELKNYQDKLREKENLIERISSINLEKIEDEDDFSHNYLSSRVNMFKLATSELLCPHCGMGVFVERSKLVKGTTKSRDEQIEIIAKLAKTNDEISKREKIEKLKRDILKYVDLVEPEEVEKPEELKLKEYIPLSELKEVKKPEKFQIEAPTLNYHTNRIFEFCIEKIPKFLRFQELQNIDTDYDVKLISENRKKYSKIQNDINVCKEFLKQIPKFDESLEEKKVACENKIKKFEKKKQLFVKVNESINLENEIEKKKKEQVAIVKKIQDLEELKNEIESIARDTIDSFVDAINTSLQDICERLFDRPIEISLQTTKELATTKKEKAVINLVIIYDGVVYNSPADLSGGEKKRVSLALLLAFMKCNPSKICILDEVLPSMDDDLKIRALEIIMEECSDKFVINICHGIPEGKHNNVIVI